MKKRKYERKLKASYAFDGRMNLKTSQCGLFVSKFNLYLETSTDAIIITYQMRAVVEVKCPFTGREGEGKP